jgi:predicted PurR-regulated permease PerM
MDDTDLLFIVIAVVVAVVFVGAALWMRVKGAQYYRLQLEQQLRALEALHQQWDQMGVQERASKQAQVGQALSQLSQLQAQVNNITRQQHQNRISNLTGLAARAGITNWHP